MIFAVCFQTNRGGPHIWITVEAESARQAVDQIRKEYVLHKIAGCYKEQPEWKWRTGNDEG